MDGLTLFGLVAVTAMLSFYALEDRSPWFILAFAGACLLASAYGFLQGAWPFGVVEAIWAGVAVHRWRKRLGRDARGGVRTIRLFWQRRAYVSAACQPWTSCRLSPLPPAVPRPERRAPIRPFRRAHRKGALARANRLRPR